jgi:hypothetical protein
MKPPPRRGALSGCLAPVFLAITGDDDHDVWLYPSYWTGHGPWHVLYPRDLSREESDDLS